MLALKAVVSVLILLLETTDLLKLAMTEGCAAHVLPLADQRMREEIPRAMQRSSRAPAGDAPYATPPAPPVEG